MAKKTFNLAPIVCNFLLLTFLCGTVQAEQKAKQTVLLITIDSLRPDFLGTYNPEKKISPNLDKFAGKSFQFTNAYSPASWTKPSLASMFTSSHFSQHLVGYLSTFSMNQEGPDHDKIAAYKKLLENMEGVKFDEKKFELFERRAKRIPESFPFLPELMKGYQRAGLTGNPNLLKQDGFERGWDEFQYISEDPDLKNISKQGFWKSSTPEINEKVLKFLDKNKTENVFIWAHYNDVHYPYGRQGKFAENVYQKHFDVLSKNSGPVRTQELFSKAKYDPKTKEVLVDLYEAGISQFDQDMGELFSELDKRKLTDQMLIIVTADHGEEFFEHGEFKHGNNLYNETIHIPFLVKIPNQNSHVVVQTPVSLTDIAPTILDFSQVLPPKEFVGRSLMPIFKGETVPDRPIFSEQAFTNIKDLVAVISNRLKMIIDLQTGQEQIFDLSKDPKEQSAISGDFKNIYSKRLRKHFENNIPKLVPLGVLLYQQDLKKDYVKEDVDPDQYKETLDKLKALGYL
jgi:arylsulfatase A-like enzyme